MSMLADLRIVKEGDDLYWEFPDGHREPATIGDVLLWEIAGTLFGISVDLAELRMELRNR